MTHGCQLPFSSDCVSQPRALEKTSAAGRVLQPCISQKGAGRYLHVKGPTRRLEQGLMGNSNFLASEALLLGGCSIKVRFPPAFPKQGSKHHKSKAKKSLSHLVNQNI